MLGELQGKKLLILGGVPAMIEVIERAHELGIKVFVTDYLEDSPAKKYADQSFLVSTTDVDAVVSLCKRANVDGIFTGNVDLLLPYYAQICEKAGLPCYGSLDLFQLMTDKRRFKDTCRQYGVPTIEEYSVEQFDTIEYPVIVKPIDSSGSRGISVCGNKEELTAAIKKALEYSPSKQYIVEKYMTGDEVVLYYYCQDGEPVFACMCDRYTNSEQHGVAQLPTAYIFPSIHTNRHLAVTDRLIRNMLKKIGMQNGPLFLQAFIHDGIPYLYEPGYRTNGAREQYIVSAISGVNSVDMLIHFALTGKMADAPIVDRLAPDLNGKFACKLSPLIRQGQVAHIEGLEEVRSVASVVKLVLNNQVGSIITDKKVGTLQQIAYRAFIVEDTLSQLKNTIDFIQNTIVYRDADGESMMLQPFDTDILLKREGSTKSVRRNSNG